MTGVGVVCGSGATLQLNLAPASTAALTNGRPELDAELNSRRPVLKSAMAPPRSATGRAQPSAYKSCRNAMACWAPSLS